MQGLEITTSTPNRELAAVPVWFDLLRNDAQRNGRGNAGVADRLGVSRPYVARVLTGNIPLDSVSPRLIAKVIDCYGGWDCPHTGRHIAASACRASASRTYESLSFAEVDAWRACQCCAHNPLRSPSTTSTSTTDQEARHDSQ